MLEWDLSLVISIISTKFSRVYDNIYPKKQLSQMFYMQNNIHVDSLEPTTIG